MKLWENNTPYFDSSIGQAEPEIIPYLADGENTPAIVVCAGGGYTHRAPHEAEPVAEWIQSMGISAFIVTYRLTPYTYPAILADVQRAIRLVRYKAKEFNVDPNKVGVLGFSAGGHLAMTSALHYDLAEDSGDEVDKMSPKPDAAILCYPVVTMCEDYLHWGSMNYFLGGKTEDMELRKKFSGERNVTPDTPPMFIWHNSDDKGVPVQNSLRLAEALAKNNVLYEMHIYPQGGHGPGLAKDKGRCAEWTLSCGNWLADLWK